MAESLDDIMRAYRSGGDYASSFDAIYRIADAEKGAPPWAHLQADPELVRWAERTRLDGSGSRAVVVGCGLGDDAEFLAGRGFEVAGFDVSATAIEICRRRFPDSRVGYRQHDLFALPSAWRGSFDFVLENRTIQALPAALAEAAIAAIAALPASGGDLLVLCRGRDPAEPKGEIPWPLSRTDLAGFTDRGLLESGFEERETDGVRRFLVHYRRP